MCGIVGYLAKRPGFEHPIGQTLLAMLQALSCRGPDSAGVAIFTPPGRWRLRLSAPAGLDDDQVMAILRELQITPSRAYGNGVHDATLSSRDDALRAERRVQQRLPGTEVICLGQRLELFKQVGS